MIISKEHIFKISKNILPFSDAGSTNFSLFQLLRLSLFQISVGMATVMLAGTLNRVMIVELLVPASLVAIMIAIPVLIAPLRTFYGHKSDTYKSFIGWKRIPYMWFGSLFQFGGLAIMPFAIIILSGDQTVGPSWAGEVLVAIAFLFTGIGMHITQTVGLALAADRATKENRPRVVALLYFMFLFGMGISAVVIGILLADFSKLRLIQVVQGSAVLTLILNLVAVWRQEQIIINQQKNDKSEKFFLSWKKFISDRKTNSLIWVVFWGTLAFSMQDVLLEPYGGQILGLSVSETTNLTGVWALGALLGLALAANNSKKTVSSVSNAMTALLIGIVGFSAIIFSSPMQFPFLYFLGTLFIGFGTGLFSVSLLIIAMALSSKTNLGSGFILGSWGAAQAIGAGLGIAVGGILRDVVNKIALSGYLGSTFENNSIGYIFVYHLEILFIFITLIVLGMLSQEINKRKIKDHDQKSFGLTEIPS
ncbi:MAG: BCD family MFS transporter [Pseudomonadota bacterium]|jgi:BCD family chlorophyll transporter-like MFS transporter|nr:BCD family MFS transporter [Pseudomonadota bacterium]|tara:strand:- start:1810 stop:3243 length:1434 start_codon:yes stop_codon:yes gene_type:complete